MLKFHACSNMYLSNLWGYQGSWVSNIGKGIAEHTLFFAIDSFSIDA